MYYNFYEPFIENEKMAVVVPMKYKIKETDKTHVWLKSDRLDVISQKYYGHPFGGKLILMANPNFGGNEEDFPEDIILIIPFPYKDSLQQYIDNIKNYNNFY